MTNFIRINTASVIKNSSKNILIEVTKFKKEGTQRIFFAPIVDGKRINATMYARLYDAERLANLYIKSFS